MRRLRTIVLKEWSEVFRHRLVILTFAILPLGMLAVSILSFTTIWQMTRDAVVKIEVIQQNFGLDCTDLPGLLCVESAMGAVCLALFLLLPVLTPNSFAAYSVVGEKASRTLEPLLATPIRTSELLLAKAIASILPALGSTWIASSAFAAFLLFNQGWETVTAVFSPPWVLALLVLSPLVSIFAALGALIVSSVVTEPRTAELIAGLVVTPFVIVVMSNMAGLFVLNTNLVVAACVVALAADLLLGWLAVWVFDRENILTRWR